MSYDHGPLQTWEITWKSGHVEQVQGHQVSHSGGPMFAQPFGSVEKPARVQFHGEFEGHWLLVLSVLEDEVATIRLVTNGERLPEVDA